MRRTAVSLKGKDLTVEQFQSTAFFEVEERQAFYRDPFGSMFEIPNKKTLVRKDTGEYLSTVGKNFSVIDNKHYFDAVIETLGEAEIDYRPKQAWVENDGTTNMIVSMPAFDMFKGTEEVQAAEARFSNYFNAMGRAKAVLGSVRLVCTNGMTAFDQNFQFNMTHKGNIEDKVKEAVELYMDIDNVYKQTEDRIIQLGNTNANKDKVALYIGDGEFTAQPLLTGDRWARKINEEWRALNETVNLWALYNMFTEIFSHRYGSNYSSKQRKMEQLNREVAKWNTTLL